MTRVLYYAKSRDIDFAVDALRAYAGQYEIRTELPKIKPGRNRQTYLEIDGEQRRPSIIFCDERMYPHLRQYLDSLITYSHGYGIREHQIPVVVVHSSKRKTPFNVDDAARWEKGYIAKPNILPAIDVQEHPYGDAFKGAVREVIKVHCAVQREIGGTEPVRFHEFNKTRAAIRSGRYSPTERHSFPNFIV